VKKKRVDGKDYLLVPYSSKTEIEKLEIEVGGSAHNVTVGLSKLGNRVKFLGAVGNDQNGNKILFNFKKNNVDVRGLKIIENEMTGISTVIITSDGEKTLLTYRGTNDMLNPSDIKEKIIEEINTFIFTSVLSKSCILSLEKVINVVKKNNGIVVANPSISMVRHRKKELLNLIKKSDIAIMNKEEICEFTNSKNEKQALDRMKKFNVPYCIVTLGKDGVIGKDETKFYKEKSFNVKPLDTTGAGDSFTVGFLHWFTKTKSFDESLRFGNATASLNIQSIGAAKNLPSEKDIIKLMRG
jgi:ribokinase